MLQPRYLVPLALVGVLAGSRLYHRRNLNWGATSAEVNGPLPGDDLVPDTSSISTMAITIYAAPEKVWPWLVQMGADRAGFYSHEWVENGLLHLGIHNADRIVPEWQALEVGDYLRYVRPQPGKPEIGPMVDDLDPGRALVTAMGEAPDWGATWQFILQPQGDNETRLLVRLRMTSRMPKVMAVPMWLLAPGFDYLTIGMLRGIAQRAETTPVTTGIEPAA